MTERKEWIEHMLRDLAAEPVQARDEFKQHLLTTLRQECGEYTGKRNILQARAGRRLGESFLHWAYSWWSQPAARWASVVAVLVLALVGILIPWTSQHLWSPRPRPLLTIHQGAAQVSSQQPSAPESQPSQGDVISVAEGVHITLDENSTASLLLFDGSKVELLAGTQLTLTKVQPRSIWQTQAIRLQITTGQVQVQVSPLRSPDERFEVDLPAALVSVRGTAFRAQVISPQHTYVATDEGVVEVTLHDPSQGNPLVKVPAGYEVDAIIGQPLQVRHQATSGSVAEDAIALLPSPGAARVQSGATPSPILPIGDLVTTATTSSPGTTVTTPSKVTTTVPTTGTAGNGSVITGAIPATPVGAPLSADLELVQVNTPNPTAAEGTMTYMLLIANHGPGDAQDIVVRDVLPPQVRLVDATLPAEGKKSTRTWKLGTLAAGDSRALQVVVAVHSWVTQSFTNTAVVTAATLDENPHNNQATVETAVTDTADLAVSAQIPTAIGSGSVVTCTLVYTNFGPAAAHDVTIVERLATEMSFGGVVNAELPLAPPATTMGTLMLQEPAPTAWMTLKLAAGASGRIVFTATVHPGVLGPLTSTVVITSASPDSDWSNNDYAKVTFATPVANVTIAQSVAPDPVVAGGVLTYTLAYINHGPWAAENVFITAMLPPSVTLARQVSPDLAALMQTSTADGQKIGQSLTWFTPSLLPGAGGTVVLTVMVDWHAAGPLHSHAVIRSATLDGNPDDNTAAVSVDALMPALSLAQTVQPDVIAPRQPCTYTLYVTNTGAVTFAAQSLSLVEMLPPGFRPIMITATSSVAATTSSVTVTTSSVAVTTSSVAATTSSVAATTQPVTLAQTWSWRNSAPLAPGGSFSVSLVVSAAGTVSPGLYLSTAGVTATVPVRQAQGRPGGTITATAPISVRLAFPSVAVAQQVTGDGTSIATSGRVTLTIRLTNTGPSPLAAVPLLERHDPRILRLVSADPDSEEAPGDGTINWHNLIQALPRGIRRDILPGKALTVTLAFDVAQPLTVFEIVESYVTIGKLRDVYGNLSDGYTAGGSVYKVQRLYLPVVIRCSE